MGAYMITAFLIGLWCLHSSSRHINSLIEAFILIVIAVIVKSIMEGSGLPSASNLLIATWLILYVYIVLLLKLLQQTVNKELINMIVAFGGAIAWFFLSSYLFSDTGQLTILEWFQSHHLPI